MVSLSFMPVETKKHIFSFIESLNISNRGNLYNMIKQHVEDNSQKIEDPFTSEKPVIRIHQGNQEECQSCQGWLFFRVVVYN